MIWIDFNYGVKERIFTLSNNIRDSISWILKILSRPHDATTGAEGWQAMERIEPANPL